MTTLTTYQIAERARKAAPQMAELSNDQKARGLAEIAHILHQGKEEILGANKADLLRAKTEGLAGPLLKRLKVDGPKLEEAIEGVRAVAGLKDPVGQVQRATELSPGLELRKVSCPLGVIGMIFESRPDALVQMTSLALKSGNCVLLKGGREALETNRVLAKLIQQATEKVGIPKGWMSLLETREDVQDLLKLDSFIDLLIPRGSNEFVRYIMEHTLIPVMGHADGICNGYVDANVDLDQAISVVVDSKTQYVAVCNALENLLVHRDVAPIFLPRVREALEAHSVQLRGCKRTRQIIPIAEATDKDWATEYLDYILSIKIVDSLDEAINFIHTYGSKHTDVILTKDPTAAQKFFTQVDTGSVLLNCSTRFADGFRYGLGAEVGISTGKLHARGPVGVEGLVTYKWQLVGQGHRVADFSGESPIQVYTHRNLDA